MAAPPGCCHDETSGPYWTGPVAASWLRPVVPSWCAASGLVAGTMRSCTTSPSAGPGSTAELGVGEPAAGAALAIAGTAAPTPTSSAIAVKPRTVWRRLIPIRAVGRRPARSLSARSRQPPQSTQVPTASRCRRRTGLTPCAGARLTPTWTAQRDGGAFREYAEVGPLSSSGVSLGGAGGDRTRRPRHHPPCCARSWPPQPAAPFRVTERTWAHVHSSTRTEYQRWPPFRAVKPRRLEEREVTGPAGESPYRAGAVGAGADDQTGDKHIQR